MINRLIHSLSLSSLLLGSLVFAQEEIGDNGIDITSTSEIIKKQTSRELKVLAPTLTAEEIDPAVLNKLLQEIARDPETLIELIGRSVAFKAGVVRGDERETAESGGGRALRNRGHTFAHLPRRHL